MSNSNALRYFIVCTVGKTTGNGIVFSTFEIQTEGSFPSLNKCIELTKEESPSLRNITVVSISEISEKDSHDAWATT